MTDPDDTTETEERPTDRDDGPHEFPVTRRDALGLGGATLGGVALAGGAVATQSDDPEDGDESGDDDGGDDGGDGARRYRVTVTNLTSGQPFTPPAVAAHRPSVEVFSVGDPANEPTRQVAENGDLGPLVELVESTEAIRGAAVGDAPLVPKADPGDTGNPYYASLELSADASATHLTFLSMLVATNDGIVGLDTVPLPDAVNASYTYYANGYDVGTEQNTELFADLVPPAKTLILGGEPEGTAESDPELAEDGVIAPHPGISGVGNLPPEVYDWDEPAAVLQVERLS
ncbi:spondin domain-containing protein [Halorarius halobius]|uniref:spondin domain-containing protein n=1 Tax=Halorarius halobius TaxID=2962671 RepID=UPI0020CDFA9F|nr:spondin domain-containing protein [Halorarius halobius]